MTHRTAASFFFASPLGLILCAGKSEEHVELLQLDQSSIRVAEYVTELPPREVLGRKLHAAVAAARKRIETSPAELPPADCA